MKIDVGLRDLRALLIACVEAESWAGLEGNRDLLMRVAKQCCMVDWLERVLAARYKARCRRTQDPE